MRSVGLVAGMLVVAAVATLSSAGWAEPNGTTLNFSVTRNGEPIGTTTVSLQRDGDTTVAHASTHIKVKIAYLTVYRFDQTETEKLADGRLQAMNSVTDDNGTVHKVAAQNRGNVIAVDADGKTSQVDATLIPASPWNALLVQKTAALDPRDGSVTPVSVVDHGEEHLIVQGRPTTAHHYSIATGFPQDVWYDEHHRLIKVELHGSDGSRIQYQPG